MKEIKVHLTAITSWDSVWLTIAEEGLRNCTCIYYQCAEQKLELELVLEKQTLWPPYQI